MKVWTFTDYYGQQSCTAGRAAFITGQNPIRTGLTKVGMPGADVGIRAEDPTIAELLKPLGYATGQFGKNHWETRTNFSRRCTASTSSLATSTISMPRKNPKTLTTQRTRHSRNSSDREAFSTAWETVRADKRSKIRPAH